MFPLLTSFAQTGVTVFKILAEIQTFQWHHKDSQDVCYDSGLTHVKGNLFVYFKLNEQTYIFHVFCFI